jgi:hypothetical protein
MIARVDRQKAAPITKRGPPVAGANADLSTATPPLGGLPLAATVIAAIDQHLADAGCAHFAEGDFLRVARHGRPPKGYLCNRPRSKWSSRHRWWLAQFQGH